MNLISRLLYIFVLCSISLALQGQITAPNADYIDSTQYANEDTLGNDPIFIFYSPGENGWPIKGSLQAQLTNEDSLNFTWYLFNQETMAYDIELAKDDTTDISMLDESTQGGYKVEIENSKKGIDTTFYAWVFIEEFDIQGITVFFSTCERMELRTNLQFEESFTYYDLADKTELTFSNERDSLDYEWETNTEQQISGGLRPNFTAPLEETRYTLTITDKFGFKRSDYIEINEGEHNGDGNIYLKAVKADFEASRSYIPQGESDTSGQAPLRVQFINNSMNAVDYQWVFYQHKDWMSSVDDTVIAISNFETPIDSIEFKRPGRRDQGIYDVKLEAKGPVYILNNEELQCIDSLRKHIYVDSTSLPELSNVFTPNGDNINDLFGFDPEDKPRSLKYFSIKIYSRFGTKVYQFEDNEGDWTAGSGGNGWNGDTPGFGKAKPGVYYYGIQAEGWNGQDFKRSGFLHLFRGKNDFTE